MDDNNIIYSTMRVCGSGVIWGGGGGQGGHLLLSDFKSSPMGRCPVLAI